MIMTAGGTAQSYEVIFAYVAKRKTQEIQNVCGPQPDVCVSQAVCGGLACQPDAPLLHGCHLTHETRTRCR